MSEPIPESIPTSVSRPSHRAVKRLRPSPSSPSSTSMANKKNPNASQIQTLMSHPDVPITLPPPPNASSRPSYTVPEIVPNVQGSSAGAGSGEFHVYKASRRREYERLRNMEEEARREREDEEWMAREKERRERDEREREKRARKRRGRKDKKEEKEKKKDTAEDQLKVKAGAGAEGETEQPIEKTVHVVPRVALEVSTPQAEDAAAAGVDDDDDDDDGVDGSGKVRDGVRSEDGGGAREEIGVVIHDDD